MHCLPEWYTKRFSSHTHWSTLISLHFSSTWGPLIHIFPWFLQGDKWQTRKFEELINLYNCYWVKKTKEQKKKKSPQKNPGIFQSEDAQNGNQDVIHDRVKVLEWPSLRKHHTDWGHKFCALWKIYKFVETMIQGGNDFPESFSYFIQQ